MLRQAVKNDDITSKHIQLKQIVMEMIGDNYEPGNRFLSERELMKQFNVSSRTVSKAMKALVHDNILERHIGTGSFVKDLSAIKLQKKTYHEPPILTFATFKNKIKASNPLYWFIDSEIKNGIMRSYPGRCQMKNIPDVLADIKNGATFPLILHNPQAEDIDLINKTTMPFVIINQNINEKQAPRPNEISWEAFTGIRQLISHFIETGHKKIAMISGKADSHAQRINSFKFNMQEFKLDLPLEYMIEELEGYEENGYKAMTKLLDLPNPPTAVFVDTDIKAEGAIKAVMDRGLKIPDDIAIAGFDDIPDAVDFDPPLTTIKVPYLKMGMEAVKMLQNIMNNKYPQKSKILHTELIVRKTTGTLLKEKYEQVRIYQ
jgi:Periplasmic binding protein-like domain/Bacterial regulatory proteins, gntR family